MLKVASGPIDVQDFQFKLQCRLKIFDSTEGSLTKNPSDLIASASRFGLLFVGCNLPQFKIIRFASIEDYSSSNPIGNYSRREVTLPSNPQHLDINCDHTILSVIVEKDNCPIAIFYDVKSFLSQNIAVLNEIRLSTTQGVKILSASWHPTIPAIFTECKTDGSLGIYELKGKSVDINKLPSEANATCFCWSPKGKQIAVGSKDGKLTHYKPDLKAVKVINAPPLETPNCMISVQWISTFQFIAIFKPISNSEDQCRIICIDAPKTGNPTFTNFYDVCYSNGSYRSPQFYMIFEQHWNILIVASSNSMEVGVLALTGDSWVQWTLPDSARAELPLDENRDETYPVGIAIHTSSVKPVPWGESSLQPAPCLLLLSHQGILCCFKIINLKEGAPGINSPPESLTDLSGSGTFCTGSVIPKPIQENKSVVPLNTQPPPLPKITQQSSNKQVQQEIKPIQNTFAVSSVSQNDNESKQTLQVKFPTQPVAPQPSQKSVFANVSQTVNKAPLTNLFGGQVTITPVTIKEPTSKSMTSTKGSILLTSINTATPKSITSDVAGSSNLVTPKSSNQKTAPATIGVPQTQQKIIVSSSATPVTSGNVASLAVNQLESQQEDSEEIEKILTHMIQMEYAALEKELKIILFRGKNIRINLDPESMNPIVDQTKDIDDFIVELVETSESQSSEIHVLKQNTVQTWAWLEEARSRLKEYQNVELSVLFKSKPLDSVSEKHLHNLTQMEYYLDSQLSQAHKALDEQWDKFQEYCRKVNRVQLPTMEAIFQTMVKQNAILQKHDFLLKYIISQIKGKKKIGGHTLFNHLNKNRSLEDSFHNLKLEPEDIFQIYYKKVMNRVKPISNNKSKHLRRILQNREVPHVKVNSQVPKSILQRTPEKIDKSIFVHMTPTTKQNEKPAKALNFYQSTPLNIMSHHTTQIPTSALSAFAATNTGNPTGKSPFAYMSSTGTELGKENMQNVKSDKIFNAPFAKMAETEAKAPLAANFLFNNTPKSTYNNEGSNVISKGQTGSKNFGDVISKKDYSASTSRSLLGFSQQSAVTTSTGFGTGIEKLENPVSCVLSKSSSTIKVEQNSSSNPSQSIFSSAFTNIVPSISTTLPVSTTVPKAAVSFGIPPNSGSLAVKSIEKPLVQSSPASTKSNFSSSNITLSTDTPTKSSFFSPIISGPTSGSSQQLPVASTSLSTPSAFSPLIMNQSHINNLSTSTVATSSSIFGKPLTFGSNNTPSTSSVSSQQSSSSVPHHTISNQSKPVNTSDSVTGLSSNTSLFGKSGATSSSAATGGSSSFSFLTGIKNTSSSATASLPSNSSNIVMTETADKNAPKLSQSQLFSNSSTSVNAASPTTTIAANSSFSIASTSSSIFGATITTSAQKFGTIVSSSNIFGPKTATTSQIFGSNSAIGSGLFSTTTTGSSIFSTQTTSTSQILGSSANTATSIFGTQSSSVTTAPSIFGTQTTTSQTIPSTSNIFDSSSTTISNKLSTTENSTSETTESKFGIITTTQSSSPFSINVSSIFGSSSAVTSASSNSLFSTTPATNNESIFKNVMTSKQQTFGNETGFSATSNTSIFSNTTASAVPFGTVTSANSAFNVSTTSSTPLFGEPISFGTPSTSAPFGSSTFMGSNVTSPFGMTSTSAPIFGTSTTSSSLFGNVTSAASSLFETTTTSSTTPFGATPTTPLIPFGTTAPPSTSPFGATPSMSSTTPFGTTLTNPATVFGTTSTSSATPFASSSTNAPFGKPTVFGQPFSSAFNTTQTTSSSVFGQTTTGKASIFGNSTLNAFGGTTTSSTFGSAPFGSTSSGDNSSMFGSSKSIFGGTPRTETSSGSFGFGALNVGSPTQNPEQTATKSPFGGGSFSSSSTSGSIFGSSGFESTSGGSIFGQSTFGSGSNFGTIQQQPGPFSGGSGSVSHSGFGTQSAFQKPAGFGASPAFGGSPAFGAPPTFGGAPAFGNTSPFGSPNKVFGSASQTGVFGTSTEQNSGFGNLANQNTIGFGNLAQSANNPGQNSSFSGSSSFSNWR